MSGGLDRYPVDTSQDLPAWALRRLVELIEQDLARAEAHAERFAGLGVGDAASGERSALTMVLALLNGATGGREVEVQPISLEGESSCPI